MMRALLITIFFIAPAATAFASEIQLGFRQPVYRGELPVIANKIIFVRSANHEITDNVINTLISAHQNSGLITNTQVIEQLKVLTEHTNATWVWKGAKQLKVVSNKRKISSKELQNAARKALIKQLGRDYEQVEIKTLGHIEDVAHIDGGYQLKVKLPSPFILKARMPIPIHVYVGERVVRTVSVWFSISAYKMVWTASRDFAPFSQIDSTDLNKELRDIAGITGEPIASLTDIKGKWLPSGIRESQILTRKDLQAKPWIVRGDRIRIRSQFNGIILESVGTAEEAGNEGAIINVKVDAAEAACKGRITGIGVVDVIS